MQDQEDHQHVVGLGCKDQMQMIMKGKRTKRQRLPSPLRLTMSTTTTSNSSATTTTSIDHELRNSTTEEEEDMANCLILLAQGNHHHTQKKLASSKSQLVDHNNNNKNNNNKERLYIYECKTCNRSFSSFQALGGHRASHKKLKANNVAASCAQDQKEAITTTVVNDHGFDHPANTTTNTNLTLQLSSRGLYSSNTVTPTTTKSKVHECSICGAEFQSGQALGGHMRRHRISVSNSAASMSDIGANNGNYNQEAKKVRNNALKLDLNLPAPEDDNNRESKFPFQSKEKVIVFSATSLVDCHY